jgi:hypothetical protein
MFKLDGIPRMSVSQIMDVIIDEKGCEAVTGHANIGSSIIFDMNDKISIRIVRDPKDKNKIKLVQIINDSKKTHASIV